MLRNTLITWALVVCVVAAVIAGGSLKNVDTETIWMNVNGTGDTAQVMTFVIESEVDSFNYRDTLVVNNSEDSVVVNYLTAVQKMLLTVDSDSIIDSGVYYDTVIMAGTNRDGIKWVAPLYEIGITPTTALDLNLYACTVNFAGDTLFAEWTAPSSGTTIAMVADSMVLAINAKADLTDSVLAVDGTTFYSVRSMFSGYTLDRFTVTCDSTADLPADTANIAANSVAMWADSVTALINAEAVLTDTVTAHDSATYVLLFSNFSGENLGGRWTVKQTGAADNEGQDTASHASFATLALISDSLVKALTDSLSAFLTVVDDDTGFTVTSFSAGWAFVAFLADTATDTVHTQLNVTSNSVATGSFDIGRVIFNDWHGMSLDGRFILKPSDSTDIGVGLSDSGYLWLSHKTTWGDSSLADSAFRDALPCTLSVSIADADGNNVVFGDKLTLSWRISDTASDTTSWPIEFEIEYDYTLKD